MHNLSRMTFQAVLFAAVALGTGLFLAGCGPQSEPSTKKDAQDAPTNYPASTADADHGHQHAAEGPHGGDLIELGDSPYRAELLHDKTAHKVTIHLFDAKTKQPVTSDQTEITLQIFDDGQFVDYAIQAVALDASEVGASQFATVNEKLSDALLHSDPVRGRLKVSIQGKPLVGAVENHAEQHEGASHEGDSHDHNTGEHDHNTGEHEHDTGDHEHDHGDADHAKE